MSRRNIGALFAIIAFASAKPTEARATTYKVAIMQLPVISENFRVIMKEIGEATNNTFEVAVFPPARAIYMLENKLVDVVVPHLFSKNLAFVKELKFDYSSTTTSTIPFVIYTNKDKSFDIASLRNGNNKKYVIEIDGSAIQEVGISAVASYNLENSLKKVAIGRIDGYVTSQTVGDPVLKALRLTKIRRQLLENRDLGFALQKGQRGGALDRTLTEGVQKLKENGKLDQILGKERGRYDDWQP